jgi:outer membrane protein
MKKILFGIVFSIIFSTFCFAQTQQGNFLLGGGFSASFNNHKNERPGTNNTIIISENRATSISFNPKVGIFIVDGFAIGLDADINNTSYKDKNNNTRSTSSFFAIGPFVRYYFPVNLFLEGRGGIGNGKDVAGYDKSKVFTYSVGAGYAAFLNDHIAIEPMIRYAGRNYTRVSNNDYKTRNGALEFAIGLQIYL